MSAPSAGPSDRVDGYRYAIRLRIDLSDTDAQGVVYYGRYSHYLDRGAFAYRRHLGIPPLGSATHQFVVRALSIEYYAAARFDDVVEILVRVPEMGRSSHVVEGLMELIEGPEPGPIVLMRAVIVGLDPSTGRPSPIPDEMRSAIEEFEGA